jgi:hypothetical protein
MNYKHLGNVGLIGLVVLAGCHKAATPSTPAKPQGALLRLNPQLNKPYAYSVSLSKGMAKAIFQCKVQFTFLSKKTLRDGKSTQYEANVAITDVRGTDSTVKKFPKGGLKFKQAVYDTGGLKFDSKTKNRNLKIWADLAMPDLPWKPVTANSKLLSPPSEKKNPKAPTLTREWDMSALSRSDVALDYHVTISNGKVSDTTSEQIDPKDGMLTKATSHGARDLTVERL